MRRFVVSAFLFALLAVCLSSLAEAKVVAHKVVAHISLSAQRMNVSVNGVPRYSWPVSTARAGYRTPTGTFRPTGLFRYHASTIYSGSPMPHSIFFMRGYAIHGSYETRYLGRRASHGCVRLHPSNAAALYSLVKTYGAANTVIRISH
jgi:lipoprotein-anchoring transpeptidase ErfK/SrfK